MTKRASNFELLRIVAFVFVMIVHATFLSVGVPSFEKVHQYPYSSLAIFFTQGASTICVNLFVVLSGWFGIYPKKKSVLCLLFTVFFYSVGIYLVLLSLFPEQYCNIKYLSDVLLIHHPAYWFIKSYLGLMLLAPLLNKGIENLSKYQLGIFLCCFYLYQTIYGWLTLDGADFSGGYSVVSFVGLYVLARYIRFYIPYQKIRTLYLLGCYLGIVIFQALVAWLLIYNNVSIVGRLFTYTNPLIIIETFAFFLIFTKRTFYNKYINWVAASALSVYLLHANELLLRTYYGSIIHSFSIKYGVVEFLLYTALFIISVFFVSILVDQIRQLIWHFIVKKIV